jgi:hypothetical protein
LGERLNGIQEAVGSIPISSTRRIKGLDRRIQALFLLADRVAVCSVSRRNAPFSCRPQRQVHADGVIREDDPSVVGLSQQPGRKKRLDIGVHALDIPLHSPCGLTDRHRAG